MEDIFSSFGDIFGNMGFGDIFGSRSSSRSHRTAGDLRITLKLTLEEMFSGVNKKVRNVEQQVLPINQQGWPLTRILELAKQANNARFKFDMSGFLDVDAPMIMKYTKGGHYDWHVDTGNSVCHRKLSFTIQLSDDKDYVGGDVEFIGSKVDTKAFRQKGVCIIYPSFLPHRVTKVTKGVRHAIVGWIHGPTFK